MLQAHRKKSNREFVISNREVMIWKEIYWPIGRYSYSIQPGLKKYNN